MIEFKNYYDIPNDFTGVCKLLCNMSIRYYKNGNRHREEGPALNFPNGYRDWWFKGVYYGSNDDFTIETWNKKVKELKREEELKIFL